RVEVTTICWALESDHIEATTRTIHRYSMTRLLQLPPFAYLLYSVPSKLSGFCPLRIRSTFGLWNPYPSRHNWSIGPSWSSLAQPAKLPQTTSKNNRTIRPLMVPPFETWNVSLVGSGAAITNEGGK